MTVRENLLAAAVEGDWTDAHGRADEVLAALELDACRATTSPARFPAASSGCWNSAAC